MPTPFQPRVLMAGVVPLCTFLTLMLLTGLIWRHQLDLREELLQGHTQDICIQSARRVELVVRWMLQATSIFAERWSTHPARDFSRPRFEAFGNLLIRDLPGHTAVHLLTTPSGDAGDRQQEAGGTSPGGPPPAAAGLTEQWVVPRGTPPMPPLSRREAALLQRPDSGNAPVLSAPVPLTPECTRLFALHPLRRGSEHLGVLAVELRSQALIGSLFADRIRSEFSLSLAEDGVLLFQLGLQPGAPGRSKETGREATQTLTVGQRRWQLTVAPQPGLLVRYGWTANIWGLLLGVLLSTVMGTMMLMLGRRMELYRAARDRALQEVAERHRAQTALESSEARYRGVFESATDGMLVLDSRGDILESNRAAANMYGLDNGLLNGKHLPELFVPEKIHLAQEFMRQIDMFGSARMEARIQHSDGHRLDVELRGTALRIDNMLRILAILTDVSERRRAEHRHAQLSRKVLMAQEEERARVSRELHDELGQVLTALHLELEVLQRKSRARGEDSDGLSRVLTMLEGATAELRRICRGLRPPLLDDLGLEPAIRLLVEDFEERNHVKVTLEVELEDAEVKVPPEVALCTYRVLQEALTNISRHAEARDVSISLSLRGRDLVLAVYDDGKGFDMKKPLVSSGCGLGGMRERANLVNGSLDLRSESFQGTRLVLRVPLELSRGDLP